MERNNMGRIYLPTWNMMRTLKFCVIVMMQDIRRLFQEERTEIWSYQQNPFPLTNPALFRAKAKGIELLLLLGVTGEHLLKAILLKNGFILNEEVRRMATQEFPQNLFNRITRLENSQNQHQLSAIYNSPENHLGQVSGKTISFAECIQRFNTHIVGSSRRYYSSLPNKRYTVTNQQTMNFFGKLIDTSNALVKIKKIRNNYAHLPDRMYKKTQLIRFMYNFVVFIAKTEFTTEMATLRTL